MRARHPGQHDGRRQMLAARRVLSSRALRIVACLVVAASTLAVGATAARAGAVSATLPQVVSGETPLVRHDPSKPDGEQAFHWCGSWAWFQGWEEDNALAVSPANRNNVAVAWIQDAEDAIVVGYSVNGGETWNRSIPPTTPCTGGIEDFGIEYGKSANDPELSFGPDGVAYLSSYVFGNGGSYPNGGSAAIVNRSRDGGRSWDEPVVLDEVGYPQGIDTTYVRADPYHAGHAYAVWAKGEGGALHQFVSHTTDGGETWCSTPGPCIAASSLLPKGAEIPAALSEPAGALLVLGDGTLVDITIDVPPQPALIAKSVANSQKVATPVQLQAVGPTTVVARRSSDLGATWTPPVAIALADPALVVLPRAAVAPDGTIYVAWQRSYGDASGSACAPPLTPCTHFSVIFSKSSDGGSSWQTPASVGQPEILLGPANANNFSSAVDAPSLAVADDGTVGVAFYDHRDANPATPKTTTHYRLRHSSDGGASWQEDTLAGPFDLTTAPGNFIGDYHGLAAIPGGFAASFVLASPTAGANFALVNQGACDFWRTYRTHLSPPEPAKAGDCTDVFFTRLRLGRPDLQITSLNAATNSNIREGQKIALTATVQNTGDADAAASTLALSLDGSPMPGGALATPSLPAGSSLTLSLNWDTRGVKGEHAIRASADSANAVEESNETNNTRQVTVTVRGNQIRNGSFEQSANGSSLDSWSSSGSTAYENGGSDGSRSVSTGPGGSWTSEAVPIEPGRSYDTSVVSAGVGGTLLVQQLAADGTVLGNAAQTLLPTSLFTPTTLHLTTLAGVAQARVVLLGRLSGKTTFDDVGLFSG